MKIGKVENEINNKFDEIRREILIVSETYLIDLMTGKKRITNMPDNTKVRSVYYDTESEKFCITLEGSNLLKIPRFGQLPYLMAEIESVD